MGAELVGERFAEGFHRVATLDHRAAFCDCRFEFDRSDLTAILLALEALLRQLIAVKFAFDRVLRPGGTRW